MSLLAIDTASAVPIYLQIMERIREEIRHGALTPGTPLPSVRQLAADLGVNPNTAAKAYMLLERDGIVRSIRRRGSFVAKSAPERVRQSAEARLVETLDRVVEETESLGIDRETLLKTLLRKLRAGGSSSGKDQGGQNP